MYIINHAMDSIIRPWGMVAKNNIFMQAIACHFFLSPLLLFIYLFIYFCTLPCIVSIFTPDHNISFLKQRKRQQRKSFLETQANCWLNLVYA